MLNLDDVVHDLFHPRKITHVYLVVAVTNEPLEYDLEKTFRGTTAEIEPILEFRYIKSSDCVPKPEMSAIVVMTISKHPENQLILGNSFKG